MELADNSTHQRRSESLLRFRRKTPMVSAAVQMPASQYTAGDQSIVSGGGGVTTEYQNLTDTPMLIPDRTTVVRTGARNVGADVTIPDVPPTQFGQGSNRFQ